VALKRVVALTSLRIPNLGLLVEGARNNLVPKTNSIRLEVAARNLPEWIIEGHAIDDITVLVEGEKFLARDGVPDFAGAIVAASDEFVSTLVKCAISERKQMCSEHFEKCKFLLLIFKLLLNQLYTQLNVLNPITYSQSTSSARVFAKSR
jgi:hypothetical protein